MAAELHGSAGVRCFPSFASPNRLRVPISLPSSVPRTVTTFFLLTGSTSVSPEVSEVFLNRSHQGRMDLRLLSANFADAAVSLGRCSKVDHEECFGALMSGSTISFCSEISIARIRFS